MDGHLVTAVATTPMGLFAGDFREGVFRLDSASGTWVSVGVGHAIVSSLLYVPGDTARLLVGVRPYSQEVTDAAVFATEDRGDTWKPWDGGLADSSNDQRFWAYSLAADPGEPRTLFMAGAAGQILRSSDGGATWAFVSGSQNTWGGESSTIAISPRRDGNVWVGGQDAFGQGYVQRSSDWGDSWRVSSVDVAAILALMLDPSQPGRLWAGASHGVISSDDNGQTWDVRLRGLDQLGGMALANGAFYVVRGVAPPGDSLYANVRLAIFRSVDRGMTWDALPVPSGVAGGTALALDPGGRLLVGTSRSGVWRYTPE
jgi:hypothetical protein